MNDKVPVFGQRRAGVYLLSEIYNPDNVTSSVQNVGKVIRGIRCGTDRKCVKVGEDGNLEQFAPGCVVFIH